MCVDPVTAGITFSQISTALTAASTGVAAISSIRQGNAAAAQAEMNSRLREQAARKSMDAGEKEADRRMRAAAQARGDQAVGMAANGMDVSTGDTLGILDETRDAGIEDALTIRENARSQAGNFSQQAANDRMSGAAAKSNSRWDATGTLLTGAAKVGKQYRGWASDRYGRGSF